ncbi:MAG: hypothetical protein HW388_888 [Dehalococcoidia bacterium]|nr:hypothetical protein [Dehalococcoidia bacterium]
MRKPLPLLVLLAALTLLAFGCSDGPAQGNPALPSGFTDARIPGAEFSAYLYVSQGTPLSIPTRWFGDLASTQAIPTFAALGDSVGVRNAFLGVGPTIDHYAGSVAFNGEPEADAAVRLANSRALTQAWRTGADFGIAYGQGDWLDAAKNALQASDAKPFSEAYADSWKLLRMAPSSPPNKPVAAGFAKVEGDFLEQAATRAGVSLSGVGSALGLLKVAQVAFVAYADGDLSVRDDVGPAYFKEHGASALAVMKSGYPGSLQGFLLNTFAEQAGMEKGNQVAGQDVLTRDLGDAYLIVKSIGNVVFMAIASEKTGAEKLMEAVLKQQG